MTEIKLMIINSSINKITLDFESKPDIGKQTRVYEMKHQLVNIETDIT